MENLQEGDVVELKSGGPEMTIDYATNSSYWKCCWFVAGQVYREEFAATSLKKIR